MYPSIYRNSQRRYRSASDLHAITKSAKNHPNSKKRSVRSSSFRTPIRSLPKRPLQNNKWNKIRNAASSHILFNQRLSHKEKKQQLQKLYKRLGMEPGALSKNCENILIFDPKTKVDMGAASMEMTLNHRIDFFTEHGKHINFLLSARFGVFNQIFRYIYGYETEPYDYRIMEDSIKQKLFQQNKAKLKIDFNWKFHNGNNVMHETAFGGNRDILDILLDSKCKIDIKCRNDAGYTPLQVAASKNNYYAIFRLIMAGANVDYTNCTSCTHLSNTMNDPVKGESLTVSLAMKQFQLRLHGQYHQGSDLSVRALCEQNAALKEVVSAAEKLLQRRRMKENLKNPSGKQVLDRTARMTSFTNNVQRMAKGTSLKSLIQSRARAQLHRYQSSVTLLPTKTTKRHKFADFDVDFDNDDVDDDGPSSLLVNFDSWRKSKKNHKKSLKSNRRRKSRKHSKGSSEAVVVVASATTVASQWNFKNSKAKTTSAYHAQVPELLRD